MLFLILPRWQANVVAWIKHSMVFTFWLAGAMYMQEKFTYIVPIFLTIVYAAAEAFLYSLAYPIEKEDEEDDEE